MSSVGAARKVSPNWSQELMTCHSSHCFSNVWGQENAPSVTLGKEDHTNQHLKTHSAPAQNKKDNNKMNFLDSFSVGSTK